MSKITEAQLEALNTFKMIFGRSWKAKLNQCWQAADYPLTSSNDAAELQTLRNTLGPSWLVRFSLNKANRDAAREVQQAIEDQLDDFNWVGSRHHY